MATFKVGETYTHSGNSYTITKRTSSFITVAKGEAKDFRVKVNLDRQGNETAEVDKGFRTLTAGTLNL